MTTRYRVEYALKTHRRDQFIEWIKGLLAVPFVLLSQPSASLASSTDAIRQMSVAAHERYAQIMSDVEGLVKDHRDHQSPSAVHLTVSKLKLLVPSVGTFFTPLPLKDAFEYQDKKRRISSRRFVAPSFNDIRLVLNTAQLMSLVSGGGVDLMTFDGDVTLYDDGESLNPENPVISRLLELLGRGTRIGIVTAAGYTEADKYYGRLHGLLDAIANSNLPEEKKHNLIVMGGESNFLFEYDGSVKERLRYHRRRDWILDEMHDWTEENINGLLDLAGKALRDCVSSMGLEAEVLRKERAVGIIPQKGRKLTREQLEETVLVCQRILVCCRLHHELRNTNSQQEVSDVGKKLPFCAFNGGNDVFIDIGDKSWGVLACQKYFGGIEGQKTLHVGDQFLSIGANDFKARLACTTAWIANPAETVALLDEMAELRGDQK
ncbi:IMP-specific 5-nucleotidase [Myriangium duriaei CBS 260.36]|uniref:IMP-specific 5'-nucleotidase 1 n=1 Tax=Myriangium duriaei CBS 260.36 TaxID=1168546 RepID=A0A9P4IU26_9PEZI|nr:IMP-specific 5-nucleotidase [Myriangium duriaei CBS 260.36]